MWYNKLILSALAFGMACFGFLNSAEAGEPAVNALDGQGDLAKWEITGDAKIDAAEKHGGAGALRLGAKAKAALKLRDNDGAGKVTFWVKEEGKIPAEPKTRRAGPRWGLMQSDGRVLAMGILYAPYLGDKGGCVAIDSDQKSWFNLQWTSTKRPGKWAKFTFDMQADNGLIISVDDKPQSKFDWNKTQFKGFNSIVFFGDSEEENANAIWIDDIELELGGAMSAAPTPPPPPPAAVPESDPEVAGDVPSLLPGLENKHPRLLLNEEKIARIKELYNSSEGKVFKDALDGYLGACVPPKEAKFLTDATDGQRQGYWRMPTVALHYLITGDKASFDKAVGYMKLLLSLEHWETGGETDCGMSVANIMIGAGLCLDWLWNDLDPDFREKFRKKAIYHCRAMYHGGHLGKACKTQYWQGDPANNHRWHRNAGWSACLMAAYTGAPEERWLMQRYKEEMEFVNKWLPADGTTHESPTYMIFGLSHLVLGSQISDMCIGTKYLENPFFKNVPKFLLQSITPDFNGRFNYGDMGGVGLGKLGYDLCLYKCTSMYELKDEQAALDKITAQQGSIEWGWMGLLWYDKSLVGGSADNLPATSFFEDVNVLFARDGWSKYGVGVMFKNGPYGGFTLNRYRNDNNFKYVNIAHDDPDSNSFIVYSNGKYLAESDRYSKHKRSANLNTILINGMGQLVEGRPEDTVWWQPPTRPVDMTKLSVMTALKSTPEVEIAEGEASLNYIAATDKKRNLSRPALDRYRRAMIFAKKDYILVLDDIRAPKDVDVSWLMQSPELRITSQAERKFLLKNSEVEAPFFIETNQNDAVKFNVQDSPADNKGQPLGWKQLRMESKTKHLMCASVYDVYKKDVKMTYEAGDANVVTVTVKGSGIDDKWVWTPDNGDRNGVYTLEGTRANRAAVSVGAEDRPPVPFEEKE